MKYVKIPIDRVGVLIGKNGETKSKIESYGIKIEVDSKIGEVKIESEDKIREMEAENVVVAIGRGFSPEKAFLLFNEDYYLEIIDIRDWVGKKENHIKRLAGRIIGKDGRAREIIEELSGAYVSVYGHTVGIIGKIENLQIAKKAIEMLLDGANHSTVYRFLEEEHRRKRLMEFGIK
ncbi:MAG: RNA-processing protein [Thermoplasmatales archaeon]|nr:RNA-processing protein [Thermoplasmatales archaeon]